MSFVHSEFQAEGNADVETVLLWKEDIQSTSLSKSFLVTSIDCSEELCETEEDPSTKQAIAWLDQAEKQILAEEGGIVSTLSAAGQGIESTSILLTLYEAGTSYISSLLSKLKSTEDSNKREIPSSQGLLKRSKVFLPSHAPMWTALMSNSTLYIHVVVVRQEFNGESAQNPDEAATAMGQASRSRSLLLGQVGLVKYDVPNHITKPGRILYHDIAYLFKRYIMQDNSFVAPPWEMEHSQPEYYKVYQNAQRMKQENRGYPYFKPEVAVKYLVSICRLWNLPSFAFHRIANCNSTVQIDEDSYPKDFAHVSGMELVRVIQSQEHPSSIAHIPALHVDEIGLTSEKYIPVNSTISSLPLRISFDRSDIEDDSGGTRQTTATAGGISPARWRLLSHLSQAIESQKELGIEQSDIDDLRRLIADTNVTLLGITMLASALHLLFEFLTFKSEVSFWKNNKDLIGLSVRSLFLDMIGQFIIVLFLIEKESSLLMTVPSACGVLVALWKCQRAAGLAVFKADKSKTPSMWNRLPRLLGFEIRATRLEVNQTPSDGASTGASGTTRQDRKDLHALTIECDRIATEKLSTVFLPLVAGYTLYSFASDEYCNWYSWLITSASSAVYALGFVLMTPQLFLNYKMKSVAHLPWRVLVYKSLNTFIDDLFSFIIRMPTMARISCFRDDIVFFIYLYQRWLYPVDNSRPVEGGGEVPEEGEGVAESKKNR